MPRSFDSMLSCPAPLDHRDIVELAHRYHPEGPSESLIAEFRSQPRISYLVRITGAHDHLED